MTARARLVDVLAVATLGPLLLAQGRRVRRVTPQLPEASGARAGLVPPPGCPGPALDRPFRLLIAGDSSAAGVGVATQSAALAGLLPERLARLWSRPVQWRLVARTGATVDDLIGLLGRAPPGPADAAVIAIGVNEVTARTTRAAWQARLDALRHVLRARFDEPALHFSGLPPMHRFPALPQPLRWYLGQHARALDAELADWAAAHGVHHVDTGLDRAAGAARAADAAWVASDGFHPGPAAYRFWADALARHLDATARS